MRESLRVVRTINNEIPKESKSAGMKKRNILIGVISRSSNVIIFYFKELFDAICLFYSHFILFIFIYFFLILLNFSKFFFSVSLKISLKMSA